MAENTTDVLSGTLESSTTTDYLRVVGYANFSLDIGAGSTCALERSIDGGTTWLKVNSDTAYTTDVSGWISEPIEAWYRFNQSTHSGNTAYYMRRYPNRPWKG